jgi:uncharacterized damage-inducible protein DinB
MMLIHMPDYLEWANTRALGMLTDTPSEEGIRVFAHLLAAELVWAARVTHDPPPCPVRPEWTLEECAEALPRSVKCYRAIVTAHEATRPILYHNQQGEEYTSLEGDILLHVLAHGAYHRGQISQEVRRAGGEVADTDYILFRR